MQSISADDARRRVRETIREVFRLSPEEAAGDLRLGSPPQWDSLGHMELVVAVEREFGLTFPVPAMSQMTTLDAIVRAVQTHAPGQPPAAHDRTNGET